MSRRWKLFVIVGLVTMVADQISKIWARASLPTTPEGCDIFDPQCWGVAVPVIENFFDWRLSLNPGAAFGLFGSAAGARIFLTLIGLVAIGAILWMVKKARDDQGRLIWALGLVVGGAVGNLVDRIYFGKVTDFVVWKYYDTEWPTFNIADAALVIGVGLLFLDMGKEARAEKARERAAAEAGEGQTSPKAGKGGSGERARKR